MVEIRIDESISTSGWVYYTLMVRWSGQSRWALAGSTRRPPSMVTVDEWLYNFLFLDSGSEIPVLPASLAGV